MLEEVEDMAEGGRLAKRALVWRPQALVPGADVSCRALWATDVAAVCQVDLNPSADEHTRRALGRVLRALGDLCSQHGHSLPIVGVVAGIADHMVKRWAGDQDWHRGDFALVHWDSGKPGAGEELEEILSIHLGGISCSPSHRHQLQPRGRDSYLSSIRREAGARNLSELHGYLVEELTRAVEHGGDIGTWIREVQERARQAERDSFTTV